LDEDDEDAPHRRDMTPTFQRLRLRASQQRVQPVIAAYRTLQEPSSTGPRPSPSSLVRWEGAAQCKLCDQGFSSMHGRHHCRLCGCSACSSCAPKRTCAVGKLRICHVCARVLATWQVGEGLVAAHRGALGSKPRTAAEKRALHGPLQELSDARCAPALTARPLTTTHCAHVCAGVGAHA
jgi:hypothetical protein